MKDRVGVAELKARLSAWLRIVRKGRTVTVMDRETPIALLSPIRSADGALVVRQPRGRFKTIQDVPLPPSLDLDLDPVELLLEDRRGDR